MTDVIKLVQGDSKPTITLTLTDDVTGTAVDLSAGTTTVVVNFRKAGTTTLLSAISCTKVDGANGIISFDFSGGVLDSAAGMYEGEVVISYDGDEHTLYDVLRFRVREDFA